MKIKIDEIEIKLTQEQATEFDNRVAPILQSWKQRNYTGCSFSLLDLCRDCYIQGIIDGANEDVQKIVKENK